MSAPRDVRQDLEPAVGDEDVILLAQRLRDERPLPSAGFRGELRRSLLARPPGRLHPTRVRALIVGYSLAGTAMLVAAAIGATGGHPL